MGEAVSLASATEANRWPSSTRSSFDSQWNPLDSANGRALERSARVLWPLEHRRQSILSLAKSWNLARRVGGIAATGRCCWADRLGETFCRWYGDSSASACGWGKRGKQNQEALGKSQGGFSTKLHLRVEGKGKPITFVLTAGQRHEATKLEALMEQGAVKRVGRGRPKLRPKRVLGDKAYRSRKIRHYLKHRGIGYTIPRRSDETRTGPFNRALYKERNYVERLINRLKQFRRVATRYEKRAVNFLAMVTLASIMLWL